MLGFALLGSSISLVILTFVFGFVVPHYMKNLDLGLGGGGTQVILDEAINDLTKNFDATIINVSLQVAALGLLVIVLERFTRPSSKYYDVQRKAGLMTSVMPKNLFVHGKQKVATSVPLISSEIDVSRFKDEKYRKIPKGDL